MQKVTLGILAHVDSGKTTLSEGLLYASGALRKLGRVDHGDAFLDTDALERERGITIFSKQAMLFAGDKEFTLLDTPGHVDFSAEMERTLSVLDYAVLVISGSDGVQSHTRTLWRLLTRYEVPTFLFINKMDLAGADKDALLRQLTATLSAECVDFSASQETRDEALALCDEAALEQLLERGKIDDALIAEMVKNRKVFPCFFGSALKLDGVEDFLTALACFTREPVYPKEFGAKVFKISRDAQGARLTWLKVTGGALRVKAPLTYRAQNQDYNEKADQLRLYSGVKFRALEEAGAGSVVAVTGLSHSYVGLGLGAEAEASAPLLQPVLTYQLILPDGADAHSALIKLRELEEEDPMLRIVWDERYGQIHVQLMGKIQLEILRRRILDRFGLDVTFGEGSIVYRETIAAPVLGMGHFEPLRHYAEVQLLIEPLPRGAGIQLASNVPTDALDLNWQRLIFTHLLEREHAGVLTGSPLTDVKFTLVAGRAHLKHTEGGDFRQATYRAVRQGLMQAENVEFQWNQTVESVLESIVADDGHDGRQGRRFEGERNNTRITGIKLKNVKNGEEQEIACDGVFVSVGRVPATRMIETQIALDENGYIIADESTKTNLRGVFAVGDIRTKALRQIVTATADGANAAYAVEEYLANK